MFLICSVFPAIGGPKAYRNMKHTMQEYSSKTVLKFTCISHESSASKFEGKLKPSSEHSFRLLSFECVSSLFCMDEIELKNAPKTIALGIIFNDNGEVLMIKRNPKDQDDHLGGHKLSWVFPGGVVEFAESSPEAVVREVRNETGYIVGAYDLINQRLYPGSNVYINYIACKLLSDAQFEITDVHEVEEVKWVKPEEIKSLITSDLDEALANYLGILD